MNFVTMERDGKKSKNKKLAWIKWLFIQKHNWYIVHAQVFVYIQVAGRYTDS